jgi:hypothetical protein
MPLAPSEFNSTLIEEPIMSHFSDIRTRLVHTLALCQALESLGFTVQSVEIHPNMTPQALAQIALRYANSFGDTRTAHVIARHPLLRQQETAIGFLWNAGTRSYDLQCDAYELRNSTLGHEWGYRQGHDREIEQSLTQRLQLEHDRAYVRLQYPAEQYQVTEQAIDEGIQFVIKPKTQFASIGAAI